MLVSRKNLEGVLKELSAPGVYSVDTETTGLRAHHGDSLFSLVIASSLHSYYFNFQAYKDLDDNWVLPKKETLERLQFFFTSPENTFYLHNAKFDLAMLEKEGVELRGKIYDTEVMGRLLYNRHMSYSLSNLVKEVGMEKSDEVETYIAKHKLFTWVNSPGKEKRAKWPHYDKVPYEIISRYGEQDGLITYTLGNWQREKLQELSKLTPGEKLMELLENESELTKTCYQMEKTGIKIDRAYCQRAFDYETERAKDYAYEFERISKIPFRDSRISLATAFTAAGESYPTTEKGNPSFTDEVLEGFTTPLAKLLQGYRNASKRANTYFANFLYFADSTDRIHPNIRQAGTDTGRFSFSDPNLQNVTADDEGEFPVRRAFIPDGPEWLLVSIDYQAMEYKLLLDYAGELEVIRLVKSGLDVHQATGEQMGVERKPAKTLNFLLLYGGGDQKLADALGIPLMEAKELKQKYFEKLPGVKAFTRAVMERANTRGYIFNQNGRVYHFPFVTNPKTGKLDRFAYKAPNHLIQGGCADIVRVAMNRCNRYLAGKKSKLLLQVHDELVFSVHRSEAQIVPELKGIMENAYLPKHLPMTCTVEYSDKSWADQKEWDL